MPPKPKKKKESETPAVDDKFQQLEISSRDPHTVVLMLDSPETAIVCKACEALHKHMEKSEQNCLELKDHDIIPRLVRLLTSPDKATRSYTILCLSVMATKSTVRKVLYRTDCIPPLLALLQPEEEIICHERASYTIAEVAVEYSFKVALQKHSAHEPLIRLLQESTDPDVQRNCLKSLSQLVEHYQSRPAVQEAGGLPVLLGLLASEYAIIQELALRTLLSCLQNASCRAAFREADGLAKIVTFIGNKDYADLHVLAVSLLAICLEEGGQMAALQASDTLQQLLGHISNGSGPEMKRNAAMALSRAARNAVNVKILHEQEAEKTFIQLLSDEDAGVSVAGSDGLSAMAILSSSRVAIGQWGGVEGLVKGVGREEGRVRAAAAQALAQVLTEAPANCKRVNECGGVEEVVSLLGDSEAQCRSFAADCVSSMAADDSLRASLISAKAVEALVGCLQFPDSAVQTSSSEAIAMLACDAAARQQFGGSGGVAPLLSLLHSPHDAIRQSAVWALSVCAQNAEVAQQACQSGGLELVQQLCSTPGRHTASASAALGKLLDSNLSAKYWVTGRLDQSDVISSCEFFDAGLAQSSGPFVPLSELASRPLNMNHPILTVALLEPGGKSPAPPPPPSDEHLDLSQSTVSITGRSKSRNAGTKGKKGRGEREVETSRVPADTEEPSLPPAPEKRPGLLPPDPTLWQHVTHARTHVLPLPATGEQVQQLARYVSDTMGGVVKKMGAFGYELLAGKTQQERQSNLLPLGEVTAGVFQHRALLFKVLCDHLGIGCSLVRGEYGRHWNEVTLLEEGRPKSFVVDLMYSPGQLLAVGSPEVLQYQHI